MDNEHIALLICKHLLGTLDEAERQELEQWRQASPSNELAWQRLHDSQQLLVEHHRHLLADYHHPLQDMKQQIAADAATHSNGGGRRWLAAAAVALILLAGGVLWWHRTFPGTVPASKGNTSQLAQDAIRPGTTQATLTLHDGKTIALHDETTYPRVSHTKKQPTDSTSPMATLSTPRGGEFRVILEDGTEVWLNADSRLHYPEVFDGPERRVELEGEAYFHVAKNSEKPFIVSSGGQEILVHGTSFNVHAYPEEPLITTTLVEGSIALRLSNADSRTPELMLTPGHQTRFNTHGGTFNVHEVDTEVVTSWRSGTFVFENQTLEQIMRTLSRWYDFDYEFQDQHTANTVFMGSIPKYSAFSDVCDIFHKLGGIRLTQQGRKVIISAK